MYTLNAVVAPDSYGPSATIEVSVPIKRVILDVANQAVYWSLKIKPGVWNDTEAYMLPGSRKLPGSEGCLGVRVRAAVPVASLPTGQGQAVFTAMAIT